MFPDAAGCACRTSTQGMVGHCLETPRGNSHQLLFVCGMLAQLVEERLVPLPESHRGDADAAQS